MAGRRGGKTFSRFGSGELARRLEREAEKNSDAADATRYAVDLDYYGGKQFVETAQEAMTDFKNRPKIVVLQNGNRMSFFDPKTGTQIESSTIARDTTRYDFYNVKGDRVFMSGTTTTSSGTVPPGAGAPAAKEPPEDIREIIQRTARDAFQSMNLQDAARYQQRLNELYGLMNQQVERDLRGGGGIMGDVVDEAAAVGSGTWAGIERSKEPMFKATRAQQQFMRRRNQTRLEQQYREEQALGLGPESEPVPPGQTRYSQWGCVFVVRWENASGWMVISGPEADRKYAMLGENNPPNWNDVIRLVTQDWTALTGRDRPRTSGPSGPGYESARSTSQRLQTGPKTGARVYSRDD